MKDNSNFEMGELPWPKLGLQAFRTGTDLAVTSRVHWFGMDSDEGCAEGFKEAIELIVARLPQGERLGQPDQLFYPVAYLSRHYLELMQKHLIVEGSKLVPPRVSRASLKRQRHELDRLWRQLRPILEALWPNEVDDDLDAVENVIQEFHKIDPNGTSFRYTDDIARLPHEVDLRALWEAVRDVGALFEGCSAAIEEGLSNQGYI